MRSAEGISIGRSAALADNSARFITHQVSLIIFFILLLWAGLAQAELSAFLTAGRISMGDTVQLQVEAEGQISASPDTQPLEQDFDVLGVASGSRVNIINGRMDSRSTWSITLSPKRSGTLTIPPLELHGEQTQPLTLQVSEVPVMEDGTAGNDPVFIETEVDISDPYVQGMLLYTLRLFYEVKLMGGRLSEPKLDNALVRRLGKDREYHTERNGRRYRVLERQYAIFPQTSGKLELPAPILEARIPDKRPKSNSLLRDLLKRDPLMDGSRLSDLYTTTHPIRVRGKPRVLQVRPRPAQMQAHHWLPAQNLVLIESWKPAQGELRVGNPLTRSIIIKARGATGAQLPELAPGYVDGFKVYPDRSQTDTLDLDQGVEGEKKQNVAYVPLQPGNYTLPSVKLYWWDTRSDRERVAELPERRVEVLPALSGQGMPGQTATTTEQTVQSPPFRLPEVGRSALLQRPQSDGLVGRSETRILGNAGIWPWLSLVFALLWLATLMMWWRGRGRVPDRQPDHEQDKKRGTDAVQARSRFQAACRSNDARQARSSLLEWAAAHWPDDPPTGLDELARRLEDPQLAETLQALDRTLYRGATQTWEGRALAQRLGKLPKQDRTRVNTNPLPDLYA